MLTRSSRRGLLVAGVVLTALAVPGVSPATADAVTKHFTRSTR